MITNSPVPMPKPPSARASSAHVRFVGRRCSAPRRRDEKGERVRWRVVVTGSVLAVAAADQNYTR